MAAGTLPLKCDWLANEVDTLRNSAAAATATAAAAGTLSALGAPANGVIRGGVGCGAVGLDVVETVDVRLFPTRVVCSGDGGGSGRARAIDGSMGLEDTTAAAAMRAGSGVLSDNDVVMYLKMRLSLDVHQVVRDYIVGQSI